MSSNKAQVWAKLIEECDLSGLSQAKFCEDRGLKLSTFYGWKSRLKKRGLLSGPKSQSGRNKVSKAKPSRFVEAVMPDEPQLPPEPKRLTLQVNERYCLALESGFDEALLLKTLKVLSRL